MNYLKAAMENAKLELDLDSLPSVQDEYKAKKAKHNKKLRNRSPRQRKKLAKQIREYNENRKPGQLIKLRMGIWV